MGGSRSSLGSASGNRLRAGFGCDPFHDLGISRRARFRSARVLMDGCGSPISRRRFVPSLDGLGELRVRRTTIHLLSARIMDARRGTVFPDDMAMGSRRLYLARFCARRIRNVQACGWRCPSNAGLWPRWRSRPTHTIFSLYTSAARCRSCWPARRSRSSSIR